MTNERSTTRASTVPIIVLGVVATAALFLCYLKYIQIIRPDVPYMDTLRLIVFYDQISDGSMSLWDTWGVSAHRGILGQLLFGLNADYFGLSILGANVATGVVIGLTAVAILVLSANEDPVFDQSRNRVALLGLFQLVVLLSLFNLSSFEVFTLDFGLTLFIKNILLLGFWACFDRTLRNSKSRVGPSFALGIFGAALVLLVAMGWSYAFVLACGVLFFDCWMRSPTKRTIFVKGFLVLGCLVLALYLYVAGGGGVGAMSGFRGGEAATELPLGTVVVAVFEGLSSVFMGLEVMDALSIPSVVQQACGFLLIAACALACISRLRGGGPKSSIPYALMAYGFACVVAVAVARGRVDPGIARSSRYFMDYSLLLVGLCWATWYGLPVSLRKNGRMQYLSAAVSLLCVAIFVPGQLFTQVQEWRKAPYRAVAFNAMREATNSGVITEKDASLLQANSIELAQRAVDIQARRRIGVFRNAATDMPLGCETRARIFRNGWYGLEQQGRWMSADSTIDATGCSGLIEMKFYIPQSFEKTLLTVHASNGAELSALLIPGEVNSMRLNVGSSGKKQIRISASNTHQPRPGDADQRALGALLGSLQDVAD